MDPFETSSLLWEQPAYEKIGVVDAQWILHQSVPSLGNQASDMKLFCAISFGLTQLVISSLPFSFQQGESQDGKAPWQGVSIKQ